MNTFITLALAFFLFVLLSPGVLLTLPPKSFVDPSNSASCGPFLQLTGDAGCATNWVAVFVHALVFTLALWVVLVKFH